MKVKMMHCILEYFKAYSLLLVIIFFHTIFKYIFKKNQKVIDAAIFSTFLLKFFSKQTFFLSALMFSVVSVIFFFYLPNVNRNESPKKLITKDANTYSFKQSIMGSAESISRNKKIQYFCITLLN